MNKLLLLYFLLSLILTSYQPNTAHDPIDKVCFLVGTLNDYNGRDKYKEIDNRIDRYYQSEKPLYSAVDSMFRTTFPDLKKKVVELKEPKRIVFELYSKSLADKIGKYYNYTPSGSMHINADLDTISHYNHKVMSELLQTADRIYSGRLKENMFKTDKQKYSFITGAFVRYGTHNDSTYYIRVYNSLSKVRVLSKLLKEMKCKNVEYKIKKGYIPTAHTVYFSPTSKMKDYFDDYIHLRGRN